VIDSVYPLDGLCILTPVFRFFVRLISVEEFGVLEEELFLALTENDLI